MIKLLDAVPSRVFVACSGGVDSMVALDFLRRRHEVIPVFVHHNTTNSDAGLQIVNDYCEQHKLSLFIRQILPATITTGQSQEEYWRDERYKEFDMLGDSIPVVTAHHLDDCVETYIWSMCNGTAKVVPYRRNNVIRPFLLNTKQELVNWATRNNLSWHDDTSNLDIKHTRNRVRHCVMPEILKINPGIHKVVRRIVQKNFELKQYQY